jgi:transketolase C-terminal domain/subunit
VWGRLGGPEAKVVSWPCSAGSRLPDTGASSRVTSARSAATMAATRSMPATPMVLICAQVAPGASAASMPWSRAMARTASVSVTMVTTMAAWWDALVAVGARDPRVVALDGEVSNSTYADGFARAYPDRYFEMLIAEQQLVAAASGLAVRGYRAFASTFAAFLPRAHDFIRMGAISGVDLRLVGSHAGVEIGADGPSQMGLEDLAMLRAVHGSTVLYPSDATSTAALVQAMAARSGISYLRTTRGAHPVLYPTGEVFPIGGSKVLRSGDHDDVTLVGAGVTVHACLGAADLLQQQGIHARVIDCYSIKPIDGATLTTAVAATSGRMVIAEDHRPEGGLASAVTDSLLAAGRSNLLLAHLAVRDMPGSGSGEELLAWAGVDADHIVAAARRLLDAAWTPDGLAAEAAPLCVRGPWRCSPASGAGRACGCPATAVDHSRCRSSASRTGCSLRGAARAAGAARPPRPAEEYRPPPPITVRRSRPACRPGRRRSRQPRLDRLRTKGGRLPTGRYPKMTARRGHRRRLAVQTPGRRSAILDVMVNPHPTVGRRGMPQVRITKQHRTSDTAWRRRHEPLPPLDPRDGDVVRAKQLQRQQWRSGAGRSR